MQVIDVVVSLSHVITIRVLITTLAKLSNDFAGLYKSLNVFLLGYLLGWFSNYGIVLCSREENYRYTDSNGPNRILLMKWFLFSSLWSFCRFTLKLFVPRLVQVTNQFCYIANLSRIIAVQFLTWCSLPNMKFDKQDYNIQNKLAISDLGFS